MNTFNITNYKPKDFAELLGISVKTLQRWDREGTLKANRTLTDRRYYTYDQYLQFKGVQPIDTIMEIIYEDISDESKIQRIKEVMSHAKELQDGNKSYRRTESQNQ